MSCYDCQQYLGCNDSRKHITLCEHYTPKCCGVPMSATNEGGTFTFTCVRCSRVFLLILPVSVLQNLLAQGTSTAL
ncbi:MAG: hypothetical protein UY76_C0028G0008 [Candidatus Uhrbacteria bacterium GW2011_GWA2_52_8d]|uniref:Uncharacterized protein n=1 Tax=Candidatus Uhrbacteria bacterium GW2011_GWA2_52_8d TaxID=1618979 RepID=A0A0G1ZVQ4_9BACT|nr:MAG: hypothetical protein UY76_C0028G0008 [Candidatus Uhrbacteria bacterium GW2011_GWA2_52_8d]